VDSEDETILWSSTIEFLQQNSPQMLHLKFDGRYIFGGLADGPYYLKDLQIYHVGDPSQTINLTEPYTTQQYNYTAFETAGVITGTITDSADNPVRNAFLIIADNDNDYSSASGKYNLVLLNEGEYNLKIEGPDTLDLDWSIYLNGSFFVTGDSLLVNSSIGQIVNVDFRSPIIISDVKDYFESQIPSNYYLMQNFPNPFNPSTLINYSIPEQTHVILKIFDMLGNEIKTLVNKEQYAGNYEVKFNASFLSSGIYFYRLQTGSFTDTKRMILIK
jgi:hypothetical protein